MIKFGRNDLGCEELEQTSFAHDEIVAVGRDKGQAQGARDGRRRRKLRIALHGFLFIFLPVRQLDSFV